VFVLSDDLTRGWSGGKLAVTFGQTERLYQSDLGKQLREARIGTQ
jgi:hypothetical protein